MATTRFEWTEDEIDFEEDAITAAITEEFYVETPTPVIAAGIAVLAEDTGRVLLLQRSLDDTDPAAGKWEFPGGTLDEGETPILAAVREFQEETGLKLPTGEWAGSWESGVYKGFIYTIKEESLLDLNPDHEDRTVLNPDDPDGDNIEVIAWWSTQDLLDNPAIREELRDTDWKIFQTAPPVQVTAEFTEEEEAFSYVDYLRERNGIRRLTEFYNNCHDEESGRFCEEQTGKQIRPPLINAGQPETRRIRIEIAPPEERKAAKAKARAWIRIAKVPSPTAVARGRAEKAKAKKEDTNRTTTEPRGGDAEDRRKQSENLFREFGGTKRGYVVDHQSGVKLHWTEDPQLNPNQYPIFTRGRIFTTVQGGGYTLDNLIPESIETNRKRGSRPVRKENLT